MPIRRLGPGDQDLWTEAVRTVLPAEDRDGRLASATEVDRALADRRCYLFVATASDAPIGLLTAYRFPDLAAGGRLVYLYDVTVLPEHRRRGTGRALVDALLDRAKQDGVRLVWAGTDVGNRAARRTFEASGAEVEGSSYVEYEWELED